MSNPYQKLSDYELRHWLAHRVAAGRWEKVAQLLTDLSFLEARAEAGQAFELAEDLYAYHPLLRQHRPGLADAALRNVLVFLETAEGRPKASFTLDNLHSWLAYRPEHGFYLALLEAARSGADTASPSALATKGRVHLANLARRDGDLERAGEVHALLAELEARGEWEQLGRAEYDTAYLYFLRHDLDEAETYFARSAEHADRGGDPVGAWVGRCLLARARFLRGKLDAAGLREVLLAALPIFTGKTDDPRKGPLAVRWVMNARAHLFEAACAAGERAEAERLLGELWEDPWLQQNRPEMRLLTAQARLAMLREEWGEAVRLFEAHLAIDARTWGGKPEARAREYLDLGIALRELGREEEAQEAWRRGLECPEHMGNRLWQERIRERLGAVTGPQVKEGKGGGLNEVSEWIAAVLIVLAVLSMLLVTSW